MKKTADIYQPKISKKALEATSKKTVEIVSENAKATALVAADVQLQNDNASRAKAEVQERRNVIDQKIADMPTEYGGRTKEKGLEPTRYDDWELKGRCVDF